MQGMRVQTLSEGPGGLGGRNKRKRSVARGLRKDANGWVSTCASPLASRELVHRRNFTPRMAR